MKLRADKSPFLEIVKIGSWTISRDLGIISSNEGKSLVLEPRLSKLLYHLCANDNRVVSREYLIEHIWEDIMVNEGSLTRAVADLRKKLLENFSNAPQIETLRKRGYKISMLPPPKIYALKFKFNKTRLYRLASLILLVVLLLWVFTYIQF